MTEATGDLTPLRILTVCLGNICRSPAAEAALTAEASRRGIAVEVDSAGTGDWHVGQPPHAPMRKAGKRVGLSIDGQGRQVTPSDFDNFDVILAMDASNHAHLQRIAPNEVAQAKVHMFRSFDETDDELDVPDPWGGPDDGYDATVALVRRAAQGVLDAIETGRLP